MISNFSRIQNVILRGSFLTPIFCLPAIVLGVMADPPSSVRAVEPAANETLAAPLTKTVARLSEQDALSAKDCSELAQTTITYGQRIKSTQQHPPEKVIRDALQAVDLGEKLEPKAADWPRVRQALEDLLKKEEPPQDQKKPEQQKQDQQKQDQPQKQDQNQQQDKERQPQDQQQSDQQKSDQQKQQQKQNQDAFGDMKDPSESPDPKPQTPDPKSPGTQKVGGQQDKKSAEETKNPELAMPLQKLDQVRNQDSPAKLQQLMQGQQQKPKPPGKDW